MRKFERPRAKRRDTSGTYQTKKTFAADLAKRLRTSSTLKINGVKITWESANVIVDSYAEVVKNAIVTKGKTTLPTLGAFQLQLRPCRSEVHTNCRHAATQVESVTSISQSAW